MQIDRIVYDSLLDLGKLAFEQLTLVYDIGSTSDKPAKWQQSYGNFPFKRFNIGEIAAQTINLAIYDGYAQGNKIGFADSLSISLVGFILDSSSIAARFPLITYLAAQVGSKKIAFSSKRTGHRLALDRMHYNSEQELLIINDLFLSANTQYFQLSADFPRLTMGAMDLIPLWNEQTLHVGNLMMDSPTFRGIAFGTSDTIGRWKHPIADDILPISPATVIIDTAVVTRASWDFMHKPAAKAAIITTGANLLSIVASGVNITSGFQRSTRLLFAERLTLTAEKLYARSSAADIYATLGNLYFDTKTGTIETKDLHLHTTLAQSPFWLDNRATKLSLTFPTGSLRIKNLYQSLFEKTLIVQDFSVVNPKLAITTYGERASFKLPKINADSLFTYVKPYFEKVLLQKVHMRNMDISYKELQQTPRPTTELGLTFTPTQHFSIAKEKTLPKRQREKVTQKAFTTTFDTRVFTYTPPLVSPKNYRFYGIDLLIKKICSRYKYHPNPSR